MTVWTARYKRKKIIIGADRWYDAREFARKSFGIPTYEGLTIKETPGEQCDNVLRWEGSAMNNTLHLVVE